MTPILDGTGKVRTPGPTFTRGNPPRWVLDCGCEVGALHVVHCPLHAAAPEMLAFMRERFESWYSKAGNIRKVEPTWVPTARALLAKIEATRSAY